MYWYHAIKQHNDYKHSHTEPTQMQIRVFLRRPLTVTRRVTHALRPNVLILQDVGNVLTDIVHNDHPLDIARITTHEFKYITTYIALSVALRIAKTMTRCNRRNTVLCFLVINVLAAL
jgi:hypothetical protein